MNLDERGRGDYRTGLTWGGVTGLVLGLPAGVALKATGYPTDELYLWWAVLGAAAVVVTVVAVFLVVRRRVALAGGLAVGAMIAMGIAPLLVLADIVGHSA